MIRISPRLRKWTKRMLLVVIVGLVLLLSLNLYIHLTTAAYITDGQQNLSPAYTALVLGAKVYESGRPSAVLRDRLDSALELYQSGKVKRFLLSGDHGKKEYDEVNHMRIYLQRKGVPKRDIFLDHAGFDTYNSVVRARDIFEAEDIIIVTQDFHLPRAVFIARNKGLSARGFIADKRTYPREKYLRIREGLASVKAAMELLINRSPKFGGEKIPITGASSPSYD